MLSKLSALTIQFVSRNRFRKEMLVVISLKLIALFLLWGLFFSHPIAHSIEKPELAKRFVG